MKKALLSVLLLMGGFIAMAQHNVPAYVPGGVLAWWPFSGNAIDSTGDGNDGIVLGPTLTTDRFGNPNSAYSFDGISNYILIPGHPSLELALIKDVTIAAWVKSYNYNYASQEQIFWRGDEAPAHDPYMLYLNTGWAYFRRDIDPGTVTNQIGISAATIDTNWHHLVGTYNFTSGIMCMYYDGVLQDSSYLPGTISYALPTYWNEIGAVDSGTWQFFYGDIDDVGAWERALAPCEISKLYLATASLITRQPVNETVTIGGTATFSISDTGAGTATYQWQENAGSGFVNLTATAPYSGVNTPTLTISPVSAADSGNQYRCMRTASVCIDSSDAAVLTVTGTTGILPTPEGGTDIVLVPNPNNGEFVLKGNSSINGNSPIGLEITNMLGQSLYSTTITPLNGRINEPLYLHGILGEGTYLLRLQGAGKNKVLKVVIIQ